MVRQDIYATLSDDVMGEKCGTSSQRGKVRRVSIWVNTDVAGQGTCDFWFDKDNNNVVMKCDIPEKWEREITLSREEKAVEAL